MSDNKSLNIQRRSFFRDLAQHWGGEIKNAVNNDNFPLLYNGLRYTAIQPTQPNPTNNTLAIYGVGCMVSVPNMTNYIFMESSEKNESLQEFIIEKQISHLILRLKDNEYSLSDITLIALDVPDNFIAEKPCLLLFSEQEAQRRAAIISTLIMNQPAGSDLYIGRIEEDLNDKTSPTWKRIFQFIEQ